MGLIQNIADVIAGIGGAISGFLSNGSPGLKEEEQPGSRTDHDTGSFSAKTVDFNTNGDMIKETLFDRDESGNVLRATEYNSDGDMLKETHFERDESGNIVRELEYDTDGKLVIEIVYDTAGNRSVETQFEYDDADDPAESQIIMQTQYEYSSEGNITSKTEYEHTINEEYKIEFNDDGSINKRVHSEYDINGHMIEKIITDYKNDRPYLETKMDGDGKPVSVTEFTDYGAVYSVEQYENGILSEKTNYNVDGNITSHGKYNNGQLSEHRVTRYDDYGDMVRERQYNRDENGKMISITDYDKYGNITKDRQYERDEAGNRISETVYENGDKIRETYYERDENGDPILTTVTSYEYEKEYIDGDGFTDTRTSLESKTVVTEDHKTGEKTESTTQYNLNFGEVSDSDIKKETTIEYDKNGDPGITTVSTYEYAYKESGSDKVDDICYLESKTVITEDHHTGEKIELITHYNEHVGETSDFDIIKETKIQYDPTTGNVTKETEYDWNRNITKEVEYDSGTGAEIRETAYEYDEDEDGLESKTVKITDNDELTTSTESYKEDVLIYKVTDDALNNLHMEEKYDETGFPIEKTVFQGDRYASTQTTTRFENIEGVVNIVSVQKEIKDYGFEKTITENRDTGITETITKERDPEKDGISSTIIKQQDGEVINIETRYTDGTFKEVEYDPERNVKTETEYDSEGNTIKETATYHDLSGNEVTRESSSDGTETLTYHNENGEVRSVCVLEFDENEEPVHSTDYDGNGNKVEERHYHTYPNGESAGYTEVTFNISGEMLKNAIYNEDGILVKETTYDTAGNIVKDADYDSEKFELKENLYNTEGEIIKETRTEFGEDDEVKKITEYDSSGHMVKETEYDFEGNVLHETEYDSDGNVISETTPVIEETVDVDIDTEKTDRDDMDDNWNDWNDPVG